MRLLRTSCYRTLVICLAASACGAMAGCGSSTSLPGGNHISIPASLAVPTVPGIPGIDLTKTDPASAKKAICITSDLWLKADAAAKQAIRPSIVQVMTHYKASPDKATRQAAQVGESILALDSQSAATKRAAWKRLCGTP